MSVVIEATDLAFWLALVAVVAAVRGALSGELGRRARRELARPVGTLVAALVVVSITVVAMADSVRFVNPDGSRPSLLDTGLARLATGTERGYSAPLATTLLQPALRVSDGGRPQRTRERLRHARVAGALSHPIALGSMGLLAGAVAGLLLASLLALLGLQKRRQALATGVFFGVVGAGLALASVYHLLGTDKVGQDILLRCLKGCRTAAVIGFVGAVFAGGVALLTAGLSAQGGRRADDVTHFLWSVVAAVPFILAVAVLQMIEPAALGAEGHLLGLALLLGTFAAPPLHRVARAELLRVREAHYVTTAAALGLGGPALFRAHLLPGVLHVFLRTFGVRVALLVLAEPVLTFVGLGMQPTTESFGNLMLTGRPDLAMVPVVWWPLAGGLGFSFALAFSVALLGDRLGHALEPRS